MPRKARQYLAGYPYHIVQRGNNREACFIESENYQFCIDGEDLHTIREAAHYSHPVGDERFKHDIEAKYGIKLGNASRGRPRKDVNEVVKI